VKDAASIKGWYRRVRFEFPVFFRAGLGKDHSANLNGPAQENALADHNRSWKKTEFGGPRKKALFWRLTGGHSRRGSGPRKYVRDDREHRQYGSRKRERFSSGSLPFFLGGFPPKKKKKKNRRPAGMPGGC